jgi:hypothetical protein
LNTLIHNPDQLSAMAATSNTYRQWNVEANKRIVPIIRSLILAAVAM